MGNLTVLPAVIFSGFSRNSGNAALKYYETKRAPLNLGLFFLL